MAKQGLSKYASKGRAYDYSHLFKDRSENARASGQFKWTKEYLERAKEEATAGVLIGLEKA